MEMATISLGHVFGGHKEARKEVVWYPVIVYVNSEHGFLMLSVLIDH
jgi:hypothetical protein